jgi:hypothetical protein
VTAVVEEGVRRGAGVLGAVRVEVLVWREGCCGFFAGVGVCRGGVWVVWVAL